jgi:hypothetical protein
MEFLRAFCTGVNDWLESVLVYLFYFMSPPVISHPWNILRMYAKVETCDWTGTFYTQVIGVHLSPEAMIVRRFG